MVMLGLPVLCFPTGDCNALNMPASQLRPASPILGALPLFIFFFVKRLQYNNSCSLDYLCITHTGALLMLLSFKITAKQLLTRLKQPLHRVFGMSYSFLLWHCATIASRKPSQTVCLMVFFVVSLTTYCATIASRQTPQAIQYILKTKTKRTKQQKKKSCIWHKHYRYLFGITALPTGYLAHMATQVCQLSPYIYFVCVILT